MSEDARGTDRIEQDPPRRRFRWWRILLQVLLALITAGLVYAIILPAIVAPKATPEIPAGKR